MKKASSARGRRRLCSLVSSTRFRARFFFAQHPAKRPPTNSMLSGADGWQAPVAQAKADQKAATTVPSWVVGNDEGPNPFPV